MKIVKTNCYQPIALSSKRKLLRPVINKKRSYPRKEKRKNQKFKVQEGSLEVIFKKVYL